MQQEITDLQKAISVGMTELEQLTDMKRARETIRAHFENKIKIQTRSVPVTPSQSESKERQVEEAPVVTGPRVLYSEISELFNETERSKLDNETFARKLKRLAAVDGDFYPLVIREIENYISGIEGRKTLTEYVCLKLTETPKSIVWTGDKVLFYGSPTIVNWILSKKEEVESKLTDRIGFKVEIIPSINYIKTVVGVSIRLTIL